MNITPDEIKNLWDEYMSEKDASDRKEGEITVKELAEIWGVAEETAYHRANVLATAGKLVKRAGICNGKRTNYYKIIVV